MIAAEAAGVLAQFGAAGLMGWMWLTERRSATIREKQLTDAHERLLNEKHSLEVVLRALESSTRVLTAIEIGQRQLLEVLGRMQPRKGGEDSKERVTRNEG